MSGIAEALIAAGSKSQVKRLGKQVKKKDLDVFGLAAEEIYHSLKKGDMESFRRSLKAALEVVRE